MRDFFSDIFDYHNHFNQKLIGQLIDNERVLPAGTIPLFCHIINAHQIWNSRITNREKFGVHQLHSLSICSQIDNDNFKETQNILKRFSLDKRIMYSNSKGNEFGNSIRDILFHIANHSSHHKGQIISALRQSGIEPIVTDYIFYKR